MGTEITIALKRLGDIETARLIVDESPPTPRAGGSAMTTIVAWRRNHRMSDTEIYGTKQEFRENVLDRMERNRISRRPRPVRVYEHESRGMVRGANETAFKPFPAWRRHRYTWGWLGWAFEGNVDRLRRIFPLDRTVAENMAVAPEMNEMSAAVFIYDPGTAPPPPPRSQRYGRLRGVQLGSTPGLRSPRSGATGTPARRSTSSWRASWPPERETQTSWNRSWTPAWTSTWAGREGSGHTTCRRTVTGRTGPGRTGGSIRWRSMQDSCADLRGSGAATTTGGPMSVS